MKWKYIEKHFSFSCQYNITQVSADGLSYVLHFHCWNPKIGPNMHFDPFLLEILWFYRETKKVIYFSTVKINIYTNFMHLWSKITSGTCQNAWNLDGKQHKTWSKH